MKVSVIMANYNTEEKFLRECIESVLNQTFSNFEFIIIDDCSTNNSVDVINSYKDKRIHLLINDKNTGLTANLNRALNMATGEFIARMDADDICMNDRFEAQVRFLESHQEYDVIGSHAGIVGSSEDYTISGNMPRDVRKCKLLFRNAGLIHSTAFFRKSFLDRTKIMYDETFKKSQDYDMWCQVMEQGNIFVMKEKLLYYRRHPNQISAKNSIEQSDFKAEIKNKYLKKIGVNFTEDEQRQFLLIDKNEIISKTVLRNALVKIAKANEKKHVYNQRNLTNEINFVWLKMILKSGERVNLLDFINLPCKKYVSTLIYLVRNISYR